MMKEIRVWDLQTRVFHWSLVVFVLSTFVTADMPRIFGLKTINKDARLSFHIGTGVAAGLLLAFRIFWGFFGPHYSRFDSPRLSPKELIRYLDSVRKNIKTSYTAHNPGASWELLIVIVSCGSCHMAFPPNALPEKSWRVMMADLQDHFGDDASIGEAERREIEDFLVGNSAEHSLEEASIKFVRSIGKDVPPLRITEIRYWNEKHKAIPPDIYRRESVKSKINCVACHKWSEYGSFEDSDIKIPRN